MYNNCGGGGGRIRNFSQTRVIYNRPKLRNFACSIQSFASPTSVAHTYTTQSEKTIQINLSTHCKLYAVKLFLCSGETCIERNVLHKGNIDLVLTHVILNMNLMPTAAEFLECFVGGCEYCHGSRFQIEHCNFILSDQLVKLQQREMEKKKERKITVKIEK